MGTSVLKSIYLETLYKLKEEDNIKNFSNKYGYEVEKTEKALSACIRVMECYAASYYNQATDTQGKTSLVLAIQESVMLNYTQLDSIIVKSILEFIFA